MRQETNNEMDLLLRRLSGRGDGGARNGETGPGDRHLDVDELSSYAQNALPAAARARYTEHLAECASCRKLVTELSLSLGAATAAAPVETGLAPSGLKAFLASLFSPLVLRYAVPALGVIVLMVIGFVALRRPPSNEFVAQVGTEQKRSVSETVQPGIVAPTPGSLEGFHDSAPAKAASEQAPVDQRSSPKRDARVGEGAATGASAAPVAKATDEIAPSETRPAVVEREPPPAAPKAAAEEERQESKEKQAEADAKKRPQPAVGTADTAKLEANKVADAPTVTERRVTEVPVQNRRYGDLQTLRPGGRVREDRARGDKDATETRSVAGRTFKKERGIWIDTAYDSSTQTVNVARGSEQFRALVADEPAINTIAEKLDGEVIVVWKGRAYRLR
jgi:hypothetical protein